MSIRIHSLFLLLLANGGFAGAADAPDKAGIEYFERSVRPLLVKHCAECHDDGNAEGGLSISSRSALLKGGDSGTSLIPGKPEESRLIQAIRYKNPDLQMPPKGVMAAAEIQALEKWVAMGAPDPRSEVVATTPTRLTGMSIDAGREFWSMKPVARPEPPTVRNAQWVQTPIDAFVLSQLEKHGLSPAPPADRRTLLRRATLDLTGLPPTVEEVDAFLEDQSPDAFQRVIERLLASPQYGVRWGRHWLDVARYADSNGLDENLAFGNAWRYRDYVIDAFNRGKPFDRFLIEQVAGDLLPDADAETRTATGFLVLGAKVLAEPDREKLVMDTIDEQLDTIGKAFLGLTLGCARCHDHKFDPILQSDYYALAGIFKSTKTFGDSNTGAIKHWNEFSLATDAEREAMKGVDSAIAEKQKAALSFKSSSIAKVRETARSKAADYLAAASGLRPGMSLAEVEPIAHERGLHPRILHHCRLHLSYHEDDPLFDRWRELTAAGDASGIATHYAALFADAEKAFAETKQADPKATTLTDPMLEAARSALHDAAGFLAVPPQPEFAFDAETLAEYYRLAEESRVLESGAPDLASAMSVADGTVTATLPIHIRGSHRNLGTPIERGVPEVLRVSLTTPEFPKEHSGRLELARWMADARHPLTSRVAVNRIWRWHFGSGLVASTENFGVLGDRPSHPELLDWLASEFVNSGWSMRELHRLILKSSAYQMSAVHPQADVAINADPENRWLWKFPMQRLDAEQIRDSVLAIAGRLDNGLGGKMVPLRNRQFVFDHTSIDHTKYESLRRAAYLPVIRNNVYTLFEQFDFPDPTMPTGSRTSTTVAPQALFLMNSELVLDSSDLLARQLIDEAATDEARLLIAYRRTLGRLPEADEVARGLAFLADATSTSLTRSDKVESSAVERAWSLLCQSLFASNEFLYVR
ncbi:Planctomycete cytochrome C [Caulifigura coniformis]|uniref:Planctomycete cytochrome C n=1 Tax=Caulifigura coniformis TaxID=2527983 RepID=A0A517SDK9_9PLAN|nr:PSD1 and planctomycete cytochrome C domain-containing protein [Caulifigura coniformis]QDT54209.1 Planctomycete cytochrome C [Caulifigura coniformis]